MYQPGQPQVPQSQFVGMESYFGCKLSLISKSEIRYEGILNSIDTLKQTVTLQNVRSHGTEGRTSTPIYPTEVEYPYIVFRSSDIKSLAVCEIPYMTPNNDPAIVAMPEMMGYSAYSAQYPQYQAPVRPFVPPAAQPVTTQPPKSVSQTLPGPVGNPISQPKTAPPAAKPPQNDLKTTATPAPAPTSVPQAQPKPATYSQTVQLHQVSQQRQPASQKAPVSDVAARGSTLTTSNGSTLHIRRIPAGQATQAPPTPTVNIQRRDPAAPAPKLQLKVQKKLDEFDFEGANAKFDKQKVIEELQQHTDKPAEEVAPHTYDKSVSFFDTISCEATEPKERESRSQLMQQRKVDAETFGGERRPNYGPRQHRGGYYQQRTGGYYVQQPQQYYQYAGYGGYARGGYQPRGGQQQGYYRQQYRNQYQQRGGQQNKQQETEPAAQP